VIVTNSQALNDHSQNFEQLMLNLDDAIRTTFQSLQRDVDTYQRDLDDQMQRMYTQRQQGELMLSALVERIDEYLRRSSGDRYGGGSLPTSLGANFAGTPSFTEAIATNGNTAATSPNGNFNGSTNGNGNYSQIQIPTFNSGQYRGQYSDPEQYRQNDTRPYMGDPTQPFDEPEPEVTPVQPTKRLNEWWIGFILVLGASVVLSFQNILVRIIFFKSNILGALDFGGLIQPSVANSFVLLLLRMAFATPIMWIVAKVIFRVDVWRDFQKLLTPSSRLLFWRVAFSALLQFCSFAFIYVALGILKPGLAVTLFFIFPTVTV
jgi:hypothetical protein